MNIKIRCVTSDDAPAISAIYRPYVEQTAISYEYTAPDAAEIGRRISETVKKYPYFVAECDGEVTGYAYAGAFKSRKAYECSAEVSIYVKEGSHKRGIGRMLYEALENALKEQGITNMYACIAVPEEEDEYLNFNSMRFHEHMGFRLAGTFSKCACKFGRWYGMIWMEKMIAEHT